VRSSMQLTEAVDHNLIKRTQEIWRPRAGDNLTDGDARQIIENVTGFFPILAEWSRTSAIDAGNPAASNNEEVRHDR
jgi:hypothetical protein